MRSPDSSASHPRKVRETMMTKGVAVLTVFLATAEEAMNRGEVGVLQCPQTLEGPIPTDEYSRLNVACEAFCTTTSLHFFFFLG